MRAGLSGRQHAVVRAGLSGRQHAGRGAGLSERARVPWSACRWRRGPECTHEAGRGLQGRRGGRKTVTQHTPRPVLLTEAQGRLHVLEGHGKDEVVLGVPGNGRVLLCRCRAPLAEGRADHAPEGAQEVDHSAPELVLRALRALWGGGVSLYTRLLFYLESTSIPALTCRSTLTGILRPLLERDGTTTVPALPCGSEEAAVVTTPPTPRHHYSWPPSPAHTRTHARTHTHPHICTHMLANTRTKPRIHAPLPCSISHAHTCVHMMLVTCRAGSLEECVQTGQDTLDQRGQFRRLELLAPRLQGIHASTNQRQVAQAERERGLGEGRGSRGSRGEGLIPDHLHVYSVGPRPTTQPTCSMGPRPSSRSWHRTSSMGRESSR